MKFITPKQAAVKLKTSENTVIRLCESGRILGAEKLMDLWSIPERITVITDDRARIKRIRNNRIKLMILAVITILILAMIACVVVAAVGSSMKGNTPEEVLQQPSIEKFPQSFGKIKHSPPPEGQAAHQYEYLYPDMYSYTEDVQTDVPKSVYLTFDDGPSDRTLEILDTLKKHDIKATFFVIGKEAEKRPDVLKRILAEGHTIGIHSYNHNYTQIYASVEDYLDDFAKTFDYIYKTVGVKCNIFRFPGGSNTKHNKDIRAELTAEMKRRGFTYYDWNVSSDDVSNNECEPENITNNILSSLHSGTNSIVLMHDAKPKISTAQSLDATISGLLSQGYELYRLTNSVKPVQFT